jgi:DNA-binding ferritin-like protein
MQPALTTSFEQVRQQSLDLLTQQLAAAVLLQERMQHSPRNLMGANFIMLDTACAQAASLMDTCTTLMAARLVDLGGTARRPIQLDAVLVAEAVWPGRSVRPFDAGGPDVLVVSGMEPLDAFGQQVLDAASTAQAYGDTMTAEVMAQVWRCVDRQLWNAAFSPEAWH